MSTPLQLTEGAVLGYQLPAQYQVDTITFGGPLDDLGCWWIPSKTTGWHGAAKPKTNRVAKPFAHGALRSPNYRAERVIAIQGTCLATDTGARLLGEDRLGALCGDPASLYQFVGTDQLGRQRVASVELADAPEVALNGERRFDFSIQFAAPDPRKHDIAWQDPISTIIAPSTGGLDFVGATGYGLSYTGATGYGVDWGTPGLPAQAEVGNYGTAPVNPLFTITGPVSQPTVVDVDSGWSIPYAADVAAGETVVINCDAFPQRGYNGYQCWSSVHGNVRPFLPFMTQWPQVDPQAVAHYQLVGLGTYQAQLMTSLRSAWW